MEEIWKDIPGYEGRYQASTLGRIRSLDHYSKEIISRQGKKYRALCRGRMLKPTLGMDEYLDITLSDSEGAPKTFRVHRLVAATFIPNPDNLPFVNHKDECKTNNNADNLEWCTHDYNMNYGTRNARISKAQTGKIHTAESKAKMSAAKKGRTWILLPDGKRKWLSVVP